MKKQLFITFLTFTFPFFVIAKPSNAELLVHLKNVAVEINNMLNEIETELNQTTENDEEITKFLFLSNIANEVLINSELWKQELLILEQYCYNTICNDLKKYIDTIKSVQINLSICHETYDFTSDDHIIESTSANIKRLYQLDENISTTELLFLLIKLYSNNVLIEKHYQLIQSIYTKHYNNYIRHNPQEASEPTINRNHYNFNKINPLDEDNLDNIAFELYNTILINLVKNVSQKITAKIKKLEKRKFFNFK